MSETAVVTGASGLLGAALVRSLLERGIKVRALYRSNVKALEGIDVEPMKADVTEPEALAKAFEGATVVYHSAAFVSIDPRDAEITRRINVDGTRNVIDAAKKTGVKRMVHVSSVHALKQDPLDEPLDEARALEDSGDASPYERSKADAEREVLAAVEAGFDAVIVNPAGVIGPHDYKPTGSGRMLFDLGMGALPALLPGGHDWVDSRDVALGAIAAAEKGRTGERYILSGRWCSLTELARLVEGATGTRAPRFVVPMPVAKVSAVFAEMQSRIMKKPPLFNRQALKVLEAKNKSMSHAKAKQELGYAPRPLEETLKDIYAWAFDAGMIKRRVA
jgi:dihydroflavonol-4-reductase